MASCLWLCHRMTDTVEFFFLSNSDQALSCGGSHLVMLAPESEVLPGQVSSTLCGGLKAKGRFSVWPAFALACSRPSYCCCCCVPRNPPSPPPFIPFGLLTLPRGRVPVVRFAKALGGTVGDGERVWSRGHSGCSGSWLVMQPVLRWALMLLNVPTVCLRSSPWFNSDYRMSRKDHRKMNLSPHMLVL